MEPTRRCWTVAGLGLFLAGFAVVLARPLLLVGVVGLGGYLLARQYRFLRAVQTVEDRLHVEQSVDRERVATERPLRVDLEATVTGEAPLPVPTDVEAAPPVGATGDRAETRAVRLPTKMDRAHTTFEASFPVAGSWTFEPARVTLESTGGLFRSTFETGTRPTITVEAPRPGAIHVGEGGERVSAGMGEHVGGDVGPGFEPAEIREYQPGDPARHIDWNATARLGNPHVQEFEAETDQVVTLVVDHREAMTTGPAGETKLEYARELALGFLGSARAVNDSLGLYAVGNEGVTARFQPHAGRAHYGRLQNALHDLEPTSAATQEGFDRAPDEARRAASALAGEDTAFARTLAPYFGAQERYVERLGDDPLFETARTLLPTAHEGAWTVLVTDDTDRAGVRETVDVIRQHNAHALVFLLPTVVFEPGGLSDLEAAYDRYRDFEDYRRKLASLPRVSVFEVGPRDRIDALFAARRRRRARTG